MEKSVMSHLFKEDKDENKDKNGKIKEKIENSLSATSSKDSGSSLDLSVAG